MWLPVRSGRPANDPVIEREADQIAAAVKERGAPVERHRLAAIVRAQAWGPQRFRRALQLAIRRGDVVAAGRSHVAPPGRDRHPNEDRR
jgi:hypothetical protein